MTPGLSGYIHRPGCDVAYECKGCGEVVCPECDASPGESSELCAACYYAEDPEPAA